MSDGCTDCGRKGGCDHRKQGMFAAIAEALDRLYPTKRWDERRDLSPEEASGESPASAVAPLLAERLASRLGTLAVHVPGGPQEYCDFVYMLCLGRTPSLIEVREGRVPAEVALAEAGAGAGAGDNSLEELYLRVSLSALVPFAAVQQVTLRSEVTEGLVLIEEAPRTGVFDPVLLPRFRSLVAVLAELDVRHLDFGEITEPPPGFDGGDYGSRYSGAPVCANYLFYPQPASSITTTAVVLSGEGRI